MTTEATDDEVGEAMEAALLTPHRVGDEVYWYGGRDISICVGFIKKITSTRIWVEEKTTKETRTFGVDTKRLMRMEWKK